MREILFKGFHPDKNGSQKVFVDGKWIKGFWVYGYYIKADKHWHKYGVHEDFIMTSAIQNGGWFVVTQRYSVIRSTVGQCTGLIDKNGKKIFEGDVCKFKDSLGYVKFDDSDSMFTFIYDTNICVDFGCIYGTELEVIGNIFENPELLEGA